jgi:hypothetical protein
MWSISDLAARLKIFLIYILLAVLSLIGYIIASRLLYRIGFPLDDAWIHQTYARNLVVNREWAFFNGQPSAGSTAPLWSGLLAIGYWLGLAPYIWTYLLGLIILITLAMVSRHGLRVLHPGGPGFAVWAGVFMLFEWHLIWAAGSGMETLLFALLILSVITQLASGKRNWLGLGLIIGVSVWIRPDGVTLLGPAILCAFCTVSGWKTRILAAIWLLIGTTILVVPYLLFNNALSGGWLPNTFFAKQAEYAIYRQIPLWKRLVSEASLPLVGVGVLLLPGIFLYIQQTLYQRAWTKLAGLLWLFGYLVLYALRLPVTYQHGRYIIPAMPVYFLFGLSGVVGWTQIPSMHLWKRVLNKAWLISLGIVSLLFWFLGARSYAQDVAIIESNMVVTAHWVSENTDPEALIAAHDIGALGYFGGRKLLDLAGLVSPEVVPFIRNEAKLETYLDDSHADYLVTFPGWYPHLVCRGRLVFSSGGEFSPASGGENMAVYQWLPPSMSQCSN